MAKRNGLDEAFTSGGSRHQERYVLYCGRRGTGNLDEVHIFAAPYAAKKWLELVVQGDEYVIEGNTYLRTASGIVIRAGHMGGHTVREIWEHEYTREEDLWDMPQPYLSQALHFRALSTGLVKPRYDTTIASKERRAPRTPRASRDGLVTIGAIATELKRTPRELRGYLRKWKIEKPVAGWAWKIEEADAIKERLTKEMRK